MVCSKKRLGKADAARVGIEEIQIWLEEFLRVGRDNVFHAGWSEIINRAGMRRSVLRLYKSGVMGRRTLADSGAEVTTVAHEEERGNRLERVQQTKHAALAFTHRKGKRFEQGTLQRDPVRRRVYFVLGEFELAVADIFVGKEFDFLEADDLGANEDVAVGMGVRGFFVARGQVEILRFAQENSLICARLGGGDFEDTHLRVSNSVGVVVDVDALDVGFAFFEVEMLNVVLLAAVKVNGFFVKEDQRTGEIDFADHVWRAGDVDNHEIVAGYRAQADGIGGLGFLRPVVVFPSEMQKTGLREPCTQIGQIHIAESFARCEGQFERGAFQVVDEDFEIVGLDESVLGRVAEKIVRMAHDVLIKRRGGSDQHGAGTSTAASGASRTLPGSGNRAG